MNVKDDAMTETPAPAATSHSRIGVVLLASVLIVAIAAFAWIRLRVDSGESLVPTTDLSAQALDQAGRQQPFQRRCHRRRPAQQCIQRQAG